MKILIRNLDRTTNEDELKLLFQEYGTVQSCNLVTDKVSGTSKGFAFIEMPKVGEAKAAIKNLNYKTLGENKIRVKKAEPKAADTPED
ncbi:RNA recognition motif domain-containing protein [Paraglaciecola sp. 2405UD69-4]|uniref:RNA recognition motif domain-containing protein n=1 Tax=Paraglaciecola sp. 2405UD69-4 TaxID=3391836 RepID=UPI0039C8D90E